MFSGLICDCVLFRSSGEHEGARGGRQQGHEDGRLEDLPLLHHQREDEQQSVGSVPRSPVRAGDARQVETPASDRRS